MSKMSKQTNNVHLLVQKETFKLGGNHAVNVNSLTMRTDMVIKHPSHTQKQPALKNKIEVTEQSMKSNPTLVGVGLKPHFSLFPKCMSKGIMLFP